MSEYHRRIPAGELSTLLKVSSALAASLDLPLVLQTAIESAVEVLRLDTGAIYLLENEGLILGATTPPLPEAARERLLQPEPLADHPHLRQALEERRPVYISDARNERLSPAEAAVRDLRGLRSILFIPLLMESSATGAIIVGSTCSVRNLNDEEVALCRILSYQITLAVTNARLFHSVQRSNTELMQAYDDTLMGWSLALEMRDQETQGHTRRVAGLAEELGRKMGLGEEELVHLRRGALMHDIGKMSIPDTILKKPGPLNHEERMVMQRHPDLAYQILLHINYLNPALDIPLCHHEKWDGSGYPRGLRGEEIPLVARIFAVADVYDALTSDRPYRPAWSTADARRYIRDQAGLHFDPRVTQVFLDEVAPEKPV